MFAIFSEADCRATSCTLMMHLYWDATVVTQPHMFCNEELKCCASDHIHVSSECYHTLPEIRELLRQMGSGLVVTK